MSNNNSKQTIILQINRLAKLVISDLIKILSKLKQKYNNATSPILILNGLTFIPTFRKVK